MGYGEARKAMDDYRIGRIRSLETGGALKWFLSAWGSADEAESAFDTKSENAKVASSYVSGTYEGRVPLHAKLDYVCRLRREVRKQYFGSGSELCTDVTPFRLSIPKTNGAALFDEAFDAVMSRKGEE